MQHESERARLNNFKGTTSLSINSGGGEVLWGQWSILEHLQYLSGQWTGREKNKKGNILVGLLFNIQSRSLLY